MGSRCSTVVGSGFWVQYNSKVWVVGAISRKVWVVGAVQRSGLGSDCSTVVEFGFWVK